MKILHHALQNKFFKKSFDALEGDPFQFRTDEREQNRTKVQNLIMKNNLFQRRPFVNTPIKE